MSGADQTRHNSEPQFSFALKGPNAQAVHDRCYSVNPAKLASTLVDRYERIPNYFFDILYWMCYQRLRVFRCWIYKCMCADYQSVFCAFDGFSEIKLYSDRDRCSYAVAGIPVSPVMRGSQQLHEELRRSRSHCPLFKVNCGSGRVGCCDGRFRQAGR